MKVIISGICGFMGRVVEEVCSADESVEVVAGFDIAASQDGPYPIYSNPMDFKGEADVVIDFSHPAALNGLLAFAKATKIPVVLATTGYNEEQLAEINAVAQEVPIFRSGNMSLGINVLLGIVKKAAAALGNTFDIEIVERHHRRKVDSPSGTALLIADAAASACGHETEYVYDRTNVDQPRAKSEIGISAVRGGTIVGEHTVIFAGNDEVVEIRHAAYSRQIFAQGSVAAAKFLVSVPAPRLYDMTDLVG